MNSQNIDLLALQTPYMQNDPTTRAHCYALQPLWQETANLTELLLIYSRIAEQPERVLDELARQFHVDAYDATAPRTEKVRMVLSAPRIHMYKGSVYAVEEIIAAVFGEQGKVVEWFDYDGQPYHFKVEVHCVDRGATEADIRRAEELVMAAKNLRSVLEEIRLILVGMAKIAIAAASISSETITTYPMGGWTDG